MKTFSFNLSARLVHPARRNSGSAELRQRPIGRQCLSLVTLLILCASFPRAQAAPAFPIKPSGDGPYLVDQQGKPFLWLADSGWTLVKKLTPAERDEYLDRRAAQGFTVIQFHAVSKEAGPVTTRDGLAPFEPLDNILKPVDAYWKQVDEAIAACERRGLVAAVSALWLRWGGDDTHGWRYTLTDENARAYGRFLGRRFAAHKNVVWILGGDANPRDRAFAITEMAWGIKAEAPQHLITVHNAPENPSANFFQTELWLDINFAYTYKETYQQVYNEWNRLAVERPMVLGEAGYELEGNDGRGGSPHRMRRQMWGAALSCALGGQAYGHRDIWKFSEKWREALEAPGARHLQIFKSVFASVAWTRLIPDAEQLPPPDARKGDDKELKVIVKGGGDFGKDDYAPAAHTREGDAWLAYLPAARTVTCDFGRLAWGRDGKEAMAWWIDPATGERRAADGAPFKQGGPRTITPPAKNAAGDSDWTLLVQLSNSTGAMKR